METPTSIETQILSIENYLSLLNEVISKDPLFSIHWKLDTTQKRFHRFQRTTQKKMKLKREETPMSLVFHNIQSKENYFSNKSEYLLVDDVQHKISCIAQQFAYCIARYNFAVNEYGENFALKGSYIWQESDEKYLELFIRNIDSAERVIFGTMEEFQWILDTLKTK